MWQTVALAAGAFFYVAALVGVLLVAGIAGNQSGAPLIRFASVVTNGQEAVLEVKIVASQLDADQPVGLEVAAGELTIISSRIPPDFEGKVSTRQCRPRWPPGSPAKP